MNATIPAAAVRPSPRLLDIIERAGNRLPHPITLFVVLACLVLVGSRVVSWLGLSVVHPRDGSLVTAVNLLDGAGIQRIFSEAVRNFTGFPPLGIVLAAMIGVGVAERTGLISAALETIVTAVPARFLTAAVVFAGIMSHTAADAGFLIIPPVAGLLFASAGRHPLAGIAAAFAGVGGAFSANLLPSTLDVLLADLTRQGAESARMLREGYQVQVLGNYYFMCASVPLLTLVGTWVTSRIVEPRLGPWRGAPAAPASTEEAATADALLRRRGLRLAGATLAVTLGVFALMVVPRGGPLRGPGTTTLQQIQPFFSSMVVLILLAFLLPGLAYGIATRKIRNDHHVAHMMGDTLSTMGGYIVLAFFAAQFIKYFEWSNLGAMLAISGANLLIRLHLSGTPLFLAFVVIIALMNLFVSSASAKWAVIAPVFVPMFMQLGYAPEATQLIFRIGASCTNIVTPLLPYLPIVVGFAQRYDPNVRPGTFIAMMVPYSLAFMAAWSAFLVIWLWLALPLGPGVGLAY